MENGRSEAVYQPELFDDPPRFLTGCVGAYRGQLLPVCCPDAVSLIFVTAIHVAPARTPCFMA
jgi:hypothetical protein